jgi:hypothetical protein
MLTPPARQLTLPVLDKRWNNGNERFLVPPDVFDPKRYRSDYVAHGGKASDVAGFDE